MVFYMAPNVPVRNHCSSHVKYHCVVHFFDLFQIYFSHSKTDQTGDDSAHARHLYANPHNPLLCPVTALGIYFTLCFNTDMMSDHFYFFPGK
jgi:hypothetical protein